MNLSTIKTVIFAVVIALAGGTANWFSQGETAVAASTPITISQTDETTTAEALPAPAPLSEEARTYIHEEMTTAFETAVTNAEAEGLITAEQATFLRERGLRGPHGGPGGRGMGMSMNMAGMGDGSLRDLHHEALATALGLTVEQVLAYHEAGQRLPQIVAELGLDLDTVRQAVQDAWPTVIAQAVADGRLTAEQADLLPTPHGQMGGRGGQGMHPRGQGWGR